MYSIFTLKSLKIYSLNEYDSLTKSEEIIKQIQQEYYGPPKNIWVDESSSSMLIKTADMSLHFIKDREKLWTRQEGLTTIKKWVTGRGQEIIKVEEDNINPINALIERIKDQINSVVNTAKKGVKLVSTILTEKILPKSSQKYTDGKYLFVVFH